MRIICYLFSILIVASCGNKQTYQGEGMVNYPNMVEILKDNIEPYQKGPYVYQQIISENGHSDTSILKANQVNWETLKKPFLEADIYKKEFDKMYSLDLFDEEYSPSKTWLFTALNKKAVTTKISLSVRNLDNAISSLYAETNDVGLFNSKSYKLLLVTGKTIQIQEKSKKPFSKPAHKITRLSFLN